MSIGMVAFNGRDSIKRINFPSTLKEIKQSAFWGCYGIEELVIPDNVTTIGKNAFRGLTGCETLKIGAGVTSIGDRAFFSCQKLKNIIIDSSPVAQNITSSSSQGYMLEYCNVVYTKSTINVSSIYSMKKVVSDKDGYNKWEMVISLSSKGAYKLGSEQTFDGSGNNLPYFANSYQYTDKITASIWAYKEDWSSLQSPGETMMSCTNLGGWNISYLPENYIKLEIMMSGDGDYRIFKYTTTASDLASGWHLFSFTYDGSFVRLYLDGQCVLTSNVGSEKTITRDIYSKPIVIGGECAYSSDSSAISDGYYFNGKLKGALVDNVAMSDFEIKHLYTGIIPT